LAFSQAFDNNHVFGFADREARGTIKRFGAKGKCHIGEKITPPGRALTSNHVIASKAKQSIAPRKERVDCFASLAMTLVGPNATPHSRGAIRPRFA
jgi:hypothetical protein